MTTRSRERAVLVVYGRNDMARRAMFEFLRALDLRPIEWSEATRLTRQGSPYVGTILNAAFEMARAVVVLFTPDDEARLRPEWHSTNDEPHETTLTGQARPNVLFEAGMAMGRDEKSTILVELGELRPFSDIGGRHVVRLDDSTQRRQDLAQRLRVAGCRVNLDGTDWHNAGDFKAAIAASNLREPASAERNSAQPEPPSSSSELSDGAVEMLLRANADTSKRIVVGPSKLGPRAIIAGSYPFDLSEPRARAESRDALDQLLEKAMVKQVSGDDFSSVYEVTTAGFRWLDANRELEIVSVLMPMISSDGGKLLRVAVGADGPIVCKWIPEGMNLKIGGRTFHAGDDQSSLKWAHALWELKGLELVEEDPDGMFSVTGNGRHFADRLGH